MGQEPTAIIRCATPADLSQIVALDMEAFDPYGTAETPVTLAARQAVYPAGFLVAEEGDSIIGYGSSERWGHRREPALDEDPHQSHVPDGPIFCITGMAVRYSHQRQGWGTRLLHGLLSLAASEGCQGVILETSPARRFYERHGFTGTQKRVERDATLHVMWLSRLPTSAPSLPEGHTP